jgi:hypothetical protein
LLVLEVHLLVMLRLGYWILTFWIKNFLNFINTLYDSGSRANTIDQALTETLVSGKKCGTFISDFKGTAEQVFVNNMYITNILPILGAYDRLC